ncbi:MAG: DNA-directed RNA polymerase subunit D [Haloferacaceae archaeon]
MSQEFEVEFIERGDREARFLVRGLTPAFANGIRRAMITDVPTFSIDTVRFIENSSVMFDEQIALRLGLVPLTTDLDEFEQGDEVTLALDVEGETAYSGDIETSDEYVRPADDHIPIMDLKEDQRLELEAEAVLDVGREHAKHQGGVAVGYRHLQHVEVVGEAGEFDDGEPQILRGVIETEDGELVATDEFDNDLTQYEPFQGKELHVEDVPGAFVFHVETDGSMTVAELVSRAVESIDDRAAELQEKVAV